MATQRLVLDSFVDDDYELIAIHCSLASYRLAFLLNKTLNLRLYRTHEDINFEYSDLTANFPLYTYYNDFQYSTYSLFANKCRMRARSEKKVSEGLFAMEKDTYITKYLIPELKNVDYFLKIETEASNFSSKSLLTNIQTITQVITAYTVDYTELKSKNNLIFE